MKPQRKYRLGRSVIITVGGGGGGVFQYFDAPTFTQIFRRGISLENKKTNYT